MIDSHIELLVLPGVVLHLDTQHFPVLLVTWFGTINPQLVGRYATWLDTMAARAEAENTRLIILEDTTDIEGLPGPDTRRAMAMAMEDLSVQHPGVLLGSATVITNPFMRAVATMVLAISRRKYDIRPAKNVTQAIGHITQMLESAGIAVPPGLSADTYRRPARPG